MLVDKLLYPCLVLMRYTHMMYLRACMIGASTRDGMVKADVAQLPCKMSHPLMERALGQI